jgi:hypothetical protein
MAYFDVTYTSSTTIKLFKDVNTFWVYCIGGGGKAGAVKNAGGGGGGGGGCGISYFDYYPTNCQEGTVLSISVGVGSTGGNSTGSVVYTGETYGTNAILAIGFGGNDGSGGSGGSGGGYSGNTISYIGGNGATGSSTIGGGGGGGAGIKSNGDNGGDPNLYSGGAGGVDNNGPGNGDGGNGYYGGVTGFGSAGNLFGGGGGGSVSSSVVNNGADGADGAIRITYYYTINCRNYTITKTGVDNLTFTYYDCDGVKTEVHSLTSGSMTFCAQADSITIYSGTCTLVDNGICVTSIPNRMLNIVSSF